MWSVARRPRRPTPYDQHDRRGEEEEDEGPADAGNGSMDVDEYAPRAGRAPRCAFRSDELHCMWCCFCCMMCSMALAHCCSLVWEDEEEEQIGREEGQEVGWGTQTRTNHQNTLRCSGMRPHMSRPARVCTKHTTHLPRHYTHPAHCYCCILLLHLPGTHHMLREVVAARGRSVAAAAEQSVQLRQQQASGDTTCLLQPQEETCRSSE